MNRKECSKFLRLGAISPFLLALILLVSGCSNSRNLVEKPLKNRGSQSLLNKLEKTQFEFETIGLKVNADAELEGKKQGFKANIRIRKDSAIWVSISPALGVEVFRLLVTQDSVKYVSKIPGDKHFYANDISALSDLVGTEMNYSMLQDFLVGAPMLLDFKKDKFKSRVDERSYVLISDFSRKLKRATDLDEKALDPTADTLTIAADQRKFRRIVKKSDESDLLLRRYWLEGRSYLLERIVFDDLYHNRSIEIGYDNYKETEGQYFPHRIQMQVQGFEGSQKLDLKIGRLRLNKNYKFPYKVPDDFERKYN